MQERKVCMNASGYFIKSDYISVVTNWDQAQPGHFEYPRFRKIMTEDVNAAVRGTFEGGAKAVVVTDGHGSANNILVEDLDWRAQAVPRSRWCKGLTQGISMA